MKKLICWNCGSEMIRTGRFDKNGEDAECVNKENCLHVAKVAFVLGYWYGAEELAQKLQTLIEGMIK